jgi:multidrug efflux pump subunit AcrB
MIISDTAVQKSTSVLVLSLMLIIFGVYCYLVLPRESDPDITIPNVFVSTSYKGVSSVDMETAVTIKIEKKLKGLDGLKKIQSVSSEGLSSINVEFVTGTDIDKALQDVKDKVDEAKGDLPSDLEDDPSVFEVNFSEMPIVIFTLSGSSALPSLKRLSDRLEDDIEAIPGVLEVDVTGGLEREIRIEVLPEKLAYYGLTISSLQQILAAENSNTSGGTINLGHGRFQLRVPGEFKSPDEIYTLVLQVHDGKPVYLKDVAKVVDSFKDAESRSRLNGQSAVILMVKKRAGENIISISEKVDEVIAAHSTGWPSGTKITKILDKSTDIRNMVADLENNILTGLVLVIIVIFFAMGIRNAILVSLAIPFSMLISFTVLYLMGISLNMVVLFSLTLALGMLVDNAIVIVENIYRFMEQGVPRYQAAMRATSEVAYPVIGSTVTTLAAFSPMLFWPGIMGEFMGYLPLTLIVTLSSSLFVALVINPAMASLFMKVNSSARKENTESEVNTEEQPVAIKGRILSTYTWLLGYTLDRPISIIISAFCVLIIMFQGWMLVVGLEKPVEFFPDLEPKGMYVNLEMPEGADIDYIDTVLERLELAIAGGETAANAEKGNSEAKLLAALAPKEHKTVDGERVVGPSDLVNIKTIYMKAVQSAGGGSSFDPNSPNSLGIRFIDLEKRTRSTHLTVDDIRQRVAGIAGGKITIAMEAEGPPTGAPINIEISGDNFGVLGELALQARTLLSKIPHVKDIRDDYSQGTPTVRVRIDRQKAALFGLTTNMIGFSLKAAYNGLEVSTYREGDDDYDITVQLGEQNRRVTDVLRELMIPTPTGELIPLSTLATIEFAGSISDITRINNQRVVTVKANVDETITTGPVARAEAEKFLANVHLPPGYNVKFTGENEFQQESEDFLGKAFLVALLLIFLILVSQFNSVSQPFIIMTSVILSLGGAFFGLMLYRQPFGIIMTGVGVISLAGVVVNNGIVLIDYINKLQERGFALKDAVLSGGATRLRPVILTAITTILGLIPMVTGISFDFHSFSISWVSESSQWWQSMAVVVIFGLVVATFLTLLVVPTLYYFLARLGGKYQTATAFVGRVYWKSYPILAGIKKEGDSK